MIGARGWLVGCSWRRRGRLDLSLFLKKKKKKRGVGWSVELVELVELGCEKGVLGTGGVFFCSVVFILEGWDGMHIRLTV
jgi:hypothetical protein